MNLKNVAFALLGVTLFACAPKQKPEEKIEPVAVQKASDKKVYMHMMTWFETKETNQHPDPKYVGKWGCHWTMDTCNPDSIDANGLQNIASYYHPLTGAYYSGDKNIIEYQLLLMKLAGVDGIIFDYTTLNPAWDFPMLIRNTDSIESQTQKIGLDFCILYEDQHIRDAANRNEVTDNEKNPCSKVERARLDMEYIRDRYMSQPNYIHIDGDPLLLDFGPQTFYSEAEWDTIFSVFPVKPVFFTLWYQSKPCGKNAQGEYSWIWKDHVAGLKHFYNTYEYDGLKMASAYPGFVDFYKDGGWGDGIGWNIPHRGDTTLVETLSEALNSNLDIIQLATWNDYGEGTMFEPTVEFGFTFLATLQKMLGVQNLNEDDLKLCFDLYQARVKYASSPETQAKLDRASALMAALRTAEAREIIDGLDK